MTTSRNSREGGFLGHVEGMAVRSAQRAAVSSSSACLALAHRANARAGIGMLVRAGFKLPIGLLTKPNDQGRA